MTGSGGAIKAGRAFVELLVDDNKLYRGLDAAAGKFQSWGNQLKNLGATLGAGGGALLGPLLDTLKSAVSRGNLFGTLAANTGQAVGELSGMAGMAERAGVSVERYAAAVQSLEVRSREAADANGYMFDQLKSLGTGLNFSKLSAAEKMEAIGDAVRRTIDPVQQLRIATLAYGDEVGTSLLPTLRGGAAAVRQWREEIALTDEQAAQSVAITKALNSGWKYLRDAARELGYALLPTAGELSNLSGKLKAGLGDVRAWIKENRGAVVATAAVGVGLVTAGALFVGLGTTAVATGTAIALTLAGVKIALGLLLSPVGLVVAGVAAITVGVGYLVAQTDAGQEAVAAWADEWQQLLGRVRETFGAVSDAVGAGEWQLAWQIGLAAIKAEWARFSSYFTIGWNITKGVFVDTWKDAVAGLKLIFIDLGAFIARNTAGTARDILETLGAAASKVNKKLGQELRNAASALPSRDQIDAGATAARNEVIGNRQREQQEATAARNASNRAAVQAERDARNELGRLQELARWKAEFAAMPWLEMDEEVGAGAGPAQRFSGPARLADVVKGSFGGAALSQQLGIGDTIPQQQLDATRSVAANTAQIPQLARDMNTIARGGRLGQ